MRWRNRVWAVRIAKRLASGSAVACVSVCAGLWHRFAVVLHGRGLAGVSRTQRAAHDALNRIRLDRAENFVFRAPMDSAASSGRRASCLAQPNRRALGQGRPFSIGPSIARARQNSQQHLGNRCRGLRMLAVPRAPLRFQPSNMARQLLYFRFQLGIGLLQLLDDGIPVCGARLPHWT